jgi:hypothetical protein
VTTAFSDRDEGATPPIVARSVRGRKAKIVLRSLKVLLVALLALGSPLHTALSQGPGSGGLGMAPEPVAPPLMSVWAPGFYFIAPGAAAAFDFWMLAHYVMNVAKADIINSVLVPAQAQAVITTTLVETRRYIEGGRLRLTSLMDKLERDVETWERRYPRFAYDGIRPEEITDSRERRIFDKYRFLKDEFIPQWRARIQPCIDLTLQRFAAIRTAANAANTQPPLVAVLTSIRKQLTGEAPASAPLELHGQTFQLQEQRFDAIEALASTTPEEAMAICTSRGPLSALSLLSMAFEEKVLELSDNGGTPRAEMRVTVTNNAERIALEVFVVPQGSQVPPTQTGIVIYPATVAPEDQVEPRGPRPGGVAESAWVTAEPGDEIWIRAMTLGLRRDFVRFRPIVEPNVRLVPEGLPRNFYHLHYATVPPNPLLTRWNAISETYSWSGYEGPWHVTGQPRPLVVTPDLRDPTFATANVTTDTLSWTLPDRDAVERLGELTAVVQGTTMWQREGPRAGRLNDPEAERGGGTVVMRVEFW